MIGAGGKLTLPGTVRLAPTPYRYSVLIERAKQLVGLAQQVEAGFLAAIEKEDAERYSVLRARQDVRLAKAGVSLQTLRVREAEDGVKLAELQQDRAEEVVQHYTELLEEGINTLEQASIELMIVSAAHEAAAAGIYFGTLVGVPLGLSALSGALGATASILATYASYERRAQEWEFQKNLAQHDVRISAQQVTLAEDHVRVVGQERAIAVLQADHAEAAFDFLANKFTNAELYEWMGRILEGVYGFFLQQATATAQLAEQQLAFERQEVPPPMVQGDYWTASDAGEPGADMGGKAPDRRGLTGSARLLQDIYQLDRYAFDTAKRKLQLSKTLSLASVAPVELQRFRETGVLRFDTTMESFDREFPGQYLRLVKRVRVSVIALVPPTQGIRATLSAGGLSRVVIGRDIFQKTIVRHGPQSVALSSPRDATGVFELDPQSEMLLPFEGLGVETAWELRMPKPANLFDYRTIADVLLTIDYTALDSFEYRAELMQSPAWSRPFSTNRLFRFRYDFADAWYELCHPDDITAAMTVCFTTGREDFLPNLKHLRIQHVTLYVARTGDESIDLPTLSLRFLEEGSTGPVGGEAGAVEGAYSTRHGSWTAIPNKNPAGEWEVTFANAGEMRRMFMASEIEDVLLVITYSGHLPQWPV